MSKAKVILFKRTIYRDASTAASIQIMYKQTDFLVLPPNSSFLQLVLLSPSSTEVSVEVMKFGVGEELEKVSN